jgi:murein peptide amidase A
MIFHQLPSGTTVHTDEIAVFKTDYKSKKYIYLLAGTHGDEVEGVYVLKELFNWLKTDDEMDDQPIIVIPILNVDGYKAGTRVNSHGVDLNRNCATKDWSAEFKKAKYNPGPNALSEPENKFLDKMFKEYPPAIILSFHTWKPMINYNGDSQDIAEFLNQHNGYPATPDIGYPTPGSLGAYGPEKYDAGVITFECPPFSDELSLKQIWGENEIGLKKLFKNRHLITKL